MLGSVVCACVECMLDMTWAGFYRRACSVLTLEFRVFLSLEIEGLSYEV